MPIRPREPQDLAACVAVLRRVHDDSQYPSRWPDDPVSWLSSADSIGAWVAEHGGVVAGQVVLVQREQPQPLLAATGRDSGQLAEVTRLFVDPAVRGAGLGGELLAAAAQDAADRGLRAVLQVVDDSKPAIALYERAGWTRVGSATARWSTPEGVHPTMFYYVSPS